MLALLSLLAPITVVGVLNEAGTNRCVDGDESWVDTHLTVGWSRVYGTSMPSSLKGKVVVLSGETTTPPPATQVKNDFTCPPMQMRNDWIRTRSGMRYDRNLKAPTHDLKATDIKAFDGLKLQFDAAADTVSVRLHNPLAQPMNDVTLVLHYEGCYGKPGSVTKRHPIGIIQPGKSAGITGQPARVMRKQGRGYEHVLLYVQAVSKGVPILDIDAPTRALGTTIECSDRSGRKRR
jgi:hypothetical protein